MILSMYVAEGANESGNWKRKFYVAGIKQEGKSVFACMATCMAKADEICKANGERLASFALDHEIKLDALAIPEAPKDEKTSDPEEFMKTPLGQELKRVVSELTKIESGVGSDVPERLRLTKNAKMSERLSVLKIAIEQIFGKEMKWLITGNYWCVFLGGVTLVKGEVDDYESDK